MTLWNQSANCFTMEIAFTTNFFRHWTQNSARKIIFIVKQFAYWFGCISLVETYCWNVDICKSKSSQNYESKARQADSPNAQQHTSKRQFYTRGS